MKKNIYFLLFTIITLFTFNPITNANSLNNTNTPNLACEIWDVVAEVTACEGDLFDVTINFNHSETGETFHIQGNGINYGTFNYNDVPVTLTSLAADCDTEYEFVIIDDATENCSSFTELGQVCCEGNCEITGIDFDGNPECVEGFIVADWYIFSNNTSEVGFDIYVNNDFLTFVEYDGQGPYTLEIPNTETEFFTLKACDNDNPDCCFTSEWENPCFEGDPCEIWDLVIETSDCDGGIYTVTFDFNYSGTTNNFFDWEIPGVDSGFAEFSDLPLTITIDNDLDQTHDLIINENDNPDCSAVGTYINPCFEEQPCEIWDVVAEVSACEGDLFDVVIDFNYTGNGQTFHIQGNGVNYGTFNYNDVPVTLTSLAADCDTEYEFVIIDDATENCSSFTELGQVCCEGNCEITGIDFDGNPECVDGFIVADWYIFSNNTSEVGFDIYVNNDFFTFVEYDGQGPYTLEIPNTETEFFTLKACDNDNPDCCYTSEWENPCFEGDPCEIWDLVIETSDCDGGIYTVTFDFNYSGTTNNFFDWEIPGVDSGFAEFSDLPLTITIDNDLDQTHDLIINENDNPDCSAVGTYINPCFEEQPCEIWDVVAEVSACEGDLFDVVIDFNYTGNGQTFHIQGNGINYGTFNYNDVPVTLTSLSADCDTEYEFVIIDDASENCSNFTELGQVCCEGNCEITGIDFGGNPECVDGFIVADWYIFSNNTSEVGFDIYVNNDFFTFVEYDGQGPYTLEIPNTETEFFTLKACDNDNPDCCYTSEWENPCFEADPCEIWDLVVETSECDGGIYTVTFDFNYSGTTNNFFDWEIPGVTSGFAEFSDLPLTITIGNDIDQTHDLIINENDNPECSVVGTYLNPCYEEQPCEIWDVVAEVSACEGDLFDVTINFNYSGNGQTFHIQGNGVNYGTFPYSILPVTLTSLVADCDTEYEFVIIDDATENCSSFTELGQVCCEGDCEITGIDFGGNPECAEGFIVADWYIFSNNTSEVGFDIYVNNEFLTFVEYDGQGPYTLEIPNTETEFFTLKACDNVNPDCCFTSEWENPCFEDDPCEIWDLVVETSECDGGIYTVTFDFNYSGTTNNFFNWEIPGVASGTAEFSDLPLTITIENDLDQTHDLIINENDNPDCAADISFDNPCFSEPLECTINEINVNAYEEDQSVTIDITISKEGDCSTQFNVWLNDVLLGLYEIPDNTLQITGVESSDEMLRVTVCNVNNEESCGEDEVSNPLITSVNELENNTLFFWDNHQISISNNNTFTINVAIMNINGKLLDEETLNPLTDWNKSLQSYTTGIYLISIQSKDRIKTYKIFK